MRFTKIDSTRVAALAALIVASASSCSGILGIKDVPVPVDAGPDTSGMPDASPDTLVADAPTDASPPQDVSADAPADVAADVPLDAPADVRVDSPPDSSPPPTSCTDAGRSPVLLVSAGTSILAYDPSSGASLGTFDNGGTLKLAEGMALSPNCEVFVADFSGQAIQRYDAQTGAYLGLFASTSSGPYGVTFGPDGNVYVGLSSGAVVKYDASGALVGTFAGAQGSGFGGMVFFKGELLVTYVGGTMYRFDGTTGAVIGEMYSSFSSNGPRAPVIGPDGNIYVPVWQSTLVYEFSGTTFGLVSASFVNDSSLSPIAIAWLPSGNYQGDLAALSDSTAGNDSVRVYSSNGALVTFLVTPGAGGLNRGSGMLYVP